MHAIMLLKLRYKVLADLASSLARVSLGLSLLKYTASLFVCFFCLLQYDPML